MIPSMKIGDLAELFAEASDKQIKVIVLRPGEKMHEDLISESESSRTRSEMVVHNGISYDRLVIGPSYVQGNASTFTYSSSDEVMTKQELYKKLTLLGIFDKSLEQFTGKSIEEIVTSNKV
jgi:FlaA1/EpsC-like NDP-sugar epimerase